MMERAWILAKSAVKNGGIYLYMLVVFFLVAASVYVVQVNKAFGWEFPVAIAVILVCFCITAILWFTGKKHWPIEKRFLILAILMGVLFIIFLPPGEASDEIMHFRRSYAISRGVLVPTEVVDENGNIGSSLPVESDIFIDMRVPKSGTYYNLKELIVQPKSAEDSSQAYTSAALYNFVCYIPQVIGAWMGSALGLSVIGIAYVMKIVGFIFSIFLIYFAIKKAPKFKLIFLFIALSPMTMQEITSMSPNGITIGLCLLLIAFVMYLSYEKNKIMSRRDLILLYLLAILVSLCKIVYVVLILLYLVIPKDRSGSKRKKIINLAIIVTISLVVNLVWLKISSGYLVEFMPDVSSKEQILCVLANPIRYIMTIARTICAYSYSWIENILGMSLGALCIRMPNVVFLISFAVMVLLFSQRDETIRVRKYDKVVFSGVFLTISLLICTSLYIQWTPVNKNVIEGIQGRYFLPILPLIPLIISRRKAEKCHYRNAITANTVLYYGLFINLLAVVTIFAQNI